MEKKHYEVIVVGAGMAGLLTAYFLMEQGKQVLVIEAAEVASGQTGRTTAKITSQHGLKYSKLIKDIGIEKARLYAKANEAAIREYERLIEKEHIECQFERTSAYLYSKKDAEVLKEEAKAATALGIDAYYTEKTELPFSVKGAVCFRNQAQFSALDFVEHIAAQLDILTHTKVLKIKGNRVIARDDVWTADKIVVATHYPLCNVPGFYFLRQHQERSYVLALSGCPEIKGMYLGIDAQGLSFRQMGENLLLGGCSIRTGEKKAENAFAYLREMAKKYYPDSKEATHWAAQDCMPHDGIPFIGKYSVWTPNRYVITGFQKWGMTSSMVAAMILRDELSGISSPYAKVFTPQRFYLRAAFSAWIRDVGISVKELSKGWLGKKEHRCPHMGCRLKWNKEEQSWDCPCHGSRFDKDGKILDNPSKKDMHLS
ncbi:MAG: FAD-dependent oxidoreductase [Lachnospiraceae bacterium]|nr:FAD-dependent oxidoreductase [Lachnospiraceae bacterium]